jgi:hypothetical protein
MPIHDATTVQLFNSFSIFTFLPNTSTRYLGTNSFFPPSTEAHPALIPDEPTYYLPEFPCDIEIVKVSDSSIMGRQMESMI